MSVYASPEKEFSFKSEFHWAAVLFYNSTDLRMEVCDNSIAKA